MSLWRDSNHILSAVFYLSNQTLLNLFLTYSQSPPLIYRFYKASCVLDGQFKKIFDADMAVHNLFDGITNKISLHIRDYVIKSKSFNNLLIVSHLLI
jgi:hypothetical protein